jgi:GxxExxY protein
MTKKEIDKFTYEIIGCAIEVHKFMGSCLLESVYHQFMKEELTHRKINFCTEFKIPVTYKNKLLNVDFRCDLFIEDVLVVELKHVNEIIGAHEAQLLNYMKLLKAPKGILINFNCSIIFKE